jgi:putative membrane protein
MMARPERRGPSGQRHGGVTYPAVLLAAFAVVFVALGISPTYRQDWLLENLLVLAALAVLIATCNRLRFSNASYTLLFVFFVLHEIGAHYTYSLVPYDSWLPGATRMTLSERFGLQRNHYDRLIHFAYGLLVLLPAIELLRAVAPPRGIWRHLLPLLFILSNSAIYELIEWAAAVVFGGELGTAYLGTQGDEWDSQKDMVFAASGAMVGMALMAGAHGLRRLCAPARRLRAAGVSQEARRDEASPATVSSAPHAARMRH